MRRSFQDSRLATADFLDGYVFRFMQDVLVREGADSGLEEYYKIRIENRQGGLLDYEQFVADYIRQRFPACDRRIVHAGIGLGTTTALLAAWGYRILGIEANVQRIRLARALRDGLVQFWPALRWRYELDEAYFPQLQGGELWLKRDTVLLFTNVVADWDEATMAGILATFPLVGDVILDLRTFGRLRDSEPERAELRERILALGDASLSELPLPHTEDTHYVHVSLGVSSYPAA